MRNAVIVGAPRSGTSLAASILAGAGYFVGPIRQARQRLGDDHNPYGYFEADELVERNALILSRAGFAFHNTWTSESMHPDGARAIAGLEPTAGDRAFVQAHAPRAPWVWKDPRLCFTLPYWWKILDHESTVVLLTQRDSRNAYSSFRRKGWCKRGASERRRVTQVVEDHSASARQALEVHRIPHVVIDYRDYTVDPAGVARRLSDAFCVQLTVRALNFHPELDHSGLWGNISTPIRSQLKRLPRPWVQSAARWVPKRMLGLLFPERLHLRDSAPAAPDHTASH